MKFAHEFVSILLLIFGLLWLNGYNAPFAEIIFVVLAVCNFIAVLKI